MYLVRIFPLMGVLLIAYNMFVHGPGMAEDFAWENVWRIIYLPSGLEVHLSYSDGFILFGLIVLFVEIIKSTSVSNNAIVEQMLSVLVFIAYLIQFLNYELAANPTFLFLTIMSLLDMLAGFVILTKVARRDITFGGG